MSLWISATGKVVLVFGLASFLFFGVFGMSHSAMNMGPDASMSVSNCPFISGQAILCNMNPLEHISTWQSVFTTTLQQNGTDLVLLFVVAVASALLGIKLRWPRCEHERRFAFLITVRRELHLPLPLLQELFSKGILHPKPF